MANDLMFGCLGNGITVCDKSSMENGDYKTVAHISEYGGMKLYRGHGLDSESVKRIENMAKTQAKFYYMKFMLYQKELQIRELCQIVKYDQMKGMKLSEMTSQELYDAYIKYACINEGYKMVG